MFSFYFLFIEPFIEAVVIDTVFNSDGSYSCTAQRNEIRTAIECPSQVPRKRPYIGSFAADNTDGQPHSSGIETDQFYCIYPYAFRFQCYVLAGTP